MTLEPCSHNGKTPACATMLLGRSLRKIVVASLDPNPLVNGQGRKILENSGCLFEVSSKFAEMASDLHESFIWNIQHSLPFIGLKAAVSMDGLASRSGASGMDYRVDPEAMDTGLGCVTKHCCRLENSPTG